MVNLAHPIRNCRKCDLAGQRHVPPDPRIPSQSSDIMVVGGFPDRPSAYYRKPFSGSPGRLLRSHLPADHTYHFTYIVKAKPLHRKPTVEHANICLQYLYAELNLVEPTLVILVGRFALQSILGTTVFNLNDYIGKLILRDNFTFTPLQHPTYILKSPSLYNEWRKSIADIFGTREE